MKRCFGVNLPDEVFHAVQNSESYEYYYERKEIIAKSWIVELSRLSFMQMRVIEDYLQSG